MSDLWEVKIETAATAAGGELEEVLSWYLSELGARGWASEVRAERLELRGHLSAETPEAMLIAWKTHVEGRVEGEFSVSWHRIAEQDWRSKWKASWQPRPVAEKLLIWPEWLTPMATTDRLVVKLDPGMAFGTGDHATTRLCLEALEARPRLGQFADIGCGSGVLTIAALLLGAERGWAADTDPLAVDATRQNLALNGLTGRAEVMLGSSDGVTGSVDGVVSNILAEVIIDLAPDFRRLVRPGGWGIFSGLLVTQIAAVTHALEAQGWQSEKTLTEGDWACLVGTFTR